jgi:hypothetical protein
MSPIYVPGKVVLAQTYVGIDDPDAAAYITAVETADGQSLETAVKVAIHSFVKGCKADGIWPAIKASCILAGARTLAGALVPLVGTAPTNVSFVSGDYNRKTGLIGDGSTKYLNSNRNNNTDPQNSRHLALNLSNAGSGSASLLMGCGTGSDVGRSAIARVYLPGPGDGDFFRLANSTGSSTSGNPVGFLGSTRNEPGTFVARSAGANTTFSQSSEALQNENIGVFARTTGAGFANVRANFYSIGESLNLALLDARVTDLINAFAAAIP